MNYPEIPRRFLGGDSGIRKGPLVILAPIVLEAVPGVRNGANFFSGARGGASRFGGACPRDYLNTIFLWGGCMWVIYMLYDIWL